MKPPSLGTTAVGSTLCLFLLTMLMVIASAQEPVTEKTQEQRDAEAEFYRIRREAVFQMDGDFFQHRQLTPEQQEIFIKIRLDAEDRARERARKVGSYQLSEIWSVMDEELSKAFGPNFGAEYREFVNTREARKMITETPDLNAQEWLTTEQIDKLARVWGPIYARMIDFVMSSGYKKASYEEKLALFDQAISSYLQTSKDILPEEKFAILQKRLADARPQAIEELKKESAP